MRILVPKDLELLGGLRIFIQVTVSHVSRILSGINITLIHKINMMFVSRGFGTGLRRFDILFLDGRWKLQADTVILI